MFRFSVRGRRLIAVGVPVLLLAVLVGCGRQEAEVARQEAARAEEVAKAEAARAEAERDKNLANDDPSLGSNLNAAMPSALDFANAPVTGDSGKFLSADSLAVQRGFATVS